MKKDILVITSKDDIHADSVIKYLDDNYRNKQQVIRLNTEDLALNTKVSFNGSDVFIDIEDSERKISSDKVGSVWFRRPKPIETDYQEENIHSFVKDEWSAFLRGLYFCTHDTSMWINPLPNLHRARIKLQQLQLAKRLGLNIPETIVSNDFNEVIKLFNNHDVVCAKTLDKPSFKENENKYLPIYTTILTESDFTSQKESLSISPAIFQQFITKECDIRVIIVGSSINAFAIYSKENSLAEIDFRHGFSEGLQYELITLPNHLENKLLKFVTHQGLVFSAIDMIQDKNGDYWFLENNPNGQWLWLEFATKFPLTKILSEKLVSNV